MAEEMKAEIEKIHKQRSTNDDNNDLAEQSAEVNDASVDSNPYAKPGYYNNLAQTQKREEFEKRVKSMSGNYYYYQSVNGTNCFVHPICMKVLLTEYGSYDNLPLEISGSILEIEELNMNDANRKKYKPIGHLPKAAEFKFAEIDLSTLVSGETYESFEKQIRSREKARKKKLEVENKYNDKAKKIEEMKNEYYMRKNLVVNMNKRSKLVPEWVTNNQHDETWFTLDGQEIKTDSKNPWEGNDKEAKDERPAEKIEENKSDDGNLWNEFKIKPKAADEDFPALGGHTQAKREKVPVIHSRLPKDKKAQKLARAGKKATLKYINDEGVTTIFDLSDSESQFVAKQGDDTFQIGDQLQFDSRRRGNRKRNKKRK